MATGGLPDEFRIQAEDPLIGGSLHSQEIAGSYKIQLSGIINNFTMAEKICRTSYQTKVSAGGPPFFAPDTQAGVYILHSGKNKEQL